jgi:hypothetical protein
MGFALVIKKIIGFLRKNWKVVAIIVGLLVVSGVARRFLGRVGIWWSMKKVKDNPNVIDYDFMAMSVHSAMYQGLLNLGENEGTITALVNSLKSMSEFLKLCQVYAVKYGKNLREQLRGHFNDRQYSKLLWK